MSLIDPRFFQNTFTGSLETLLNDLDVQIPPTADAFFPTGVAPLSSGSGSDICFLDNPKYAKQLPHTKAGAVFLKKDLLEKLPPTALGVVCADPYREFARILHKMYRPTELTAADGHVEEGVIIGQGAVVHPSAQLGKGTRIGENSVIGAGVCIGRDTIIAPHVTLSHAYIGDRVIIHPHAALGQDGFGFALSGKGHLKVPQLGRVIVQDDVEIGAGTAIDRGSLMDTVIGEGSKIDNLVQIGHNVVMGRNCVIAGQCAVAGSVTFEDFVVMGGQSCLAGHLTIGAGARIAGGSAVMHDVPRGVTWGGWPAKDMKTFFREHLTLSKLAARGGNRST